MAKISPWFDSPLDAVRAMSADLMTFMSAVTLILLTVAFLALADRGESFNVFWRKARHRLGSLPTHIVAIPFFQMFNITVLSFPLACDSPKSGLFRLLPLLLSSYSVFLTGWMVVEVSRLLRHGRQGD